TVFLASPPDTVFVPAETLRVVETVPFEVVRYLEPRPDTARAVLVWQIAVDSSEVLVSLRREDLRLRTPVAGEALRCIAEGPELLSCRVEGEPVPERARTIECPACAEPLIARKFRGWLTLMGLLLVAAAAGAVAVAVIK